MCAQLECAAEKMEKIISSLGNNFYNKLIESSLSVKSAKCLHADCLRVEIRE